MPAQHQNGVHKACGDGVLENTYDDTFLFTSESVGEGHPGKFPFNLLSSRDILNTRLVAHLGGVMLT